ncbi:MAG: hypothetical protein ACREPF_07535, partial [Rhodanobacteraceae bacterium]
TTSLKNVGIPQGLPAPYRAEPGIQLLLHWAGDLDSGFHRRHSRRWPRNDELFQSSRYGHALKIYTNQVAGNAAPMFEADRISGRPAPHDPHTHFFDADQRGFPWSMA